MRFSAFGGWTFRSSSVTDSQTVHAEHSCGLGGISVRPTLGQTRVATAVVTPCCFVQCFLFDPEFDLAPSGPSALRSSRLSPGVLAEPSKEQSLNGFAARRDGLTLPRKRLIQQKCPRVSACSFHSCHGALQTAVSDSRASWLLAHSPPTACLTAPSCSCGRTFAFHPFTSAPCGDDLAVRLRLASQAPVGNLSSR